MSKPQWEDHSWPQIYQSPDGNWFGVKAGWKMIIHEAWKGPEVSLLSEDGEWLSRGPIIGDWRDSLEKRP